MNKIGVIDCGMGNLTSVKNAFQRLGVTCNVVCDPSEIDSCDKIVLPGVGTFPLMIQKLNERKLKKQILKHLSLNKPFLGICLGMQVLFDQSSEFGFTKGLSVLSGKVSYLPTGKLPIPNVGWWSLSGDFIDFSENLTSNDTFYFVHSYFCQTTENYKKLSIYINGCEITVAVRYKNIFAYQFHPEKSQKSGQKILTSFVSL